MPLPPRPLYASDARRDDRRVSDDLEYLEHALVGTLPGWPSDKWLDSPEGRLWQAERLHDRLSALEDGDRIAVALAVALARQEERARCTKVQRTPSRWRGLLGALTTRPRSTRRGARAPVRPRRER
jgi:hypothetical protein